MWPQVGSRVRPALDWLAKEGLTDAWVALFVRENGAGEWARTIDLLITNQLLYQLSYAGKA